MQLNTMRLRGNPIYLGPMRVGAAIEELNKLGQPDLYGSAFDPDWDDAPEPTYWELMTTGGLR